MKACVLTELNQPLQVIDIEIPEIQRGQVLVKVLFSAVCRSQLMEVQGHRGSDPWLPHLLGHEGSGVVVDVGEGVTKVTAGDAVILTWIRGTGMEAPGAKYRNGEQVINSGRVTTFSNYTVVSENRVVKKPAELPFETAVLFGCALPTGAGMVLNELPISMGSSVVILGLGGIGLSALLAAKALGVKHLFAVDIAEPKLQRARDWGVEHVFHAHEDNLKDKIRQLTGSGADFCIESAGKADTIELGFSLICKGGGKLVFASHPPEGETIRIAPHDLISGKQITGSWGGSTEPDKDVPKIYELFSKTDLSLSSLLTERYKLEQINEALNDLDSGRTFRPLIAMDHSE